MLVLHRRDGQAVNVKMPPGGGRMRVVQLGDGRLGFEAPGDVGILREELEGRSKGPPDAADQGFSRRDVLAVAAEVGGRAGGEEMSYRHRPRVAPANVA